MKTLIWPILLILISSSAKADDSEDILLMSDNVANAVVDGGAFSGAAATYLGVSGLRRSLKTSDSEAKKLNALYDLSDEYALARRNILLEKEAFILAHPEVKALTFQAEKARSKRNQMYHDIMEELDAGIHIVPGHKDFSAEYERAYSEAKYFDSPEFEKRLNKAWTEASQQWGALNPDSLLRLENLESLRRSADMNINVKSMQELVRSQSRMKLGVAYGLFMAADVGTISMAVKSLMKNARIESEKYPAKIER